MYSWIKAGLSASVMVFALSACQGGGGKNPPDAPLAQAALENTLWKLVKLGDQPITPTPGARESSFALASETHRVQGHTGCNRMMGSYTLQGNALHFGQLATTRMACPDGVGQNEAAFLKALEAAAQWSIQGETLELRDSQGARLAVFESLYLR
jgi:heat shock protein HslJ